MPVSTAHLFQNRFKIHEGSRPEEIRKTIRNLKLNINPMVELFNSRTDYRHVFKSIFFNLNVIKNSRINFDD